MNKTKIIAATVQCAWGFVWTPDETSASIQDGVHGYWTEGYLTHDWRAWGGDTRFQRCPHCGQTRLTPPPDDPQVAAKKAARAKKD